MSRHIIVTDYNPLWAKKYEEESLLIKGILSDNCIAIYHIGSTSVPGLAAKPIIDIMVIVRSHKKVDDLADEFIKIGYDYLGEYGIAARRFLRKGGNEPTHHIHIFQAEDWNNIGRHLAFCDYMRTHEKDRDEYARIKIALAQKYPYNIEGYCDGKENFVREIEKIAFNQFDGTWDKMYIAARTVQNESNISSLLEASSVAAAVESTSGNIYVGLCVDTACTFGVCAERNAIFSMIKNGEDEVKRVIAVDSNGKAIAPCKACLELMTQLMPDTYRNIEIMVEYDNHKILKISDLTPEWSI